MNPTAAALAAGVVVVAACGLSSVAGARGRLAALSRRSWRQSVRERVTSGAAELLERADSSRWAAVACAALGAGGLGAVTYGPVAGVLAVGYGGLAIHTLLSRRAAWAARRGLVGALDGIAAVAGDLRAGVRPAEALGAALPQLIGAGGERQTAGVADLGGCVDATPRGRVLAKLAAAWGVADTTGAPLADVLDRLDIEVRSGERARAMAMAHAASARATAALLAGLPLVGVGLGYALGADPAAVLLHTPIGGFCAIAAAALQLAGLFWASRLSKVDPDQVEPLGER